MADNSSSSQTKTKNDRPGWRAILGFFILYAAIFAVNVLMGVGPNLLMKWLDVSPNVRAFAGSTFSYAVRIAALWVLPPLALQKVLRVDPWQMFFPARRDGWKDLLFGFLLGTAVLSGFFLFEIKVGWLLVDAWSWQILPFDAFLRTAWVGLLVNISVAVGEEAIFRGYLLNGLKAAWGKWSGLILMTVVFGLFHLPAYIEGGMQSGTLALGILLASLFGLLFGLTYLRTRSLWLPVSLHFTWNFIENDVLNLTGDLTNVNLIGALTRLQEPLSPGNVVVLEVLMFGVIALGVWLWLKNRRPDNTRLST